MYRILQNRKDLNPSRHELSLTEPELRSVFRVCLDMDLDVLAESELLVLLGRLVHSNKDWQAFIDRANARLVEIKQDDLRLDLADLEGSIDFDKVTKSIQDFLENEHSKVVENCKEGLAS